MDRKTQSGSYLEKLLTATHRCEDVNALLEQTLGVCAEALGVESLAVLRATPPDWAVLGCVGCSPDHAPQELAAEALDLSKLVSRDRWSSCVLMPNYALLAQGDIHEDQMSALAESLAAAILAVQGQQHGARRIRRLEKILEITHAWSQTNCMEALLQAMAEAATELLGADRASIFLWDRPNKTLVGRPALGLEDEELRIADDIGIVGQVIQSGEPRRVNSSMDRDEIARKVDEATGYNTETLLCVPLHTPNGKLIGVFEVLNKLQGNFSDEDERGLLELAEHAAVALENTKQFEDLVSQHQMLVEEAAEGVQLIGDSAPIEAVRSTIRRIADTDLAILILGENGTGKEVVARSIHYLSGRREQPFIAVNCAALSETLLESELFGHEKGAFTDAHQARAGKFELASGGTLFLDEIGDMSLSGQAKLLRVLEDKTVVRVGGSTPIHTEVRIVAATNQDLAKMVRERKFREDLYFRLNVVSLELPPLRERGDDILLLAEFFLKNFCGNMGRNLPSFAAMAKKRLLAHRWPGNVRELRNLMERLAYLSSGDQIEADDLAFIDTGDSSEELQSVGTLTEATRVFQQRYIRQTIEAAKGNMSQAAKRLGLHRSNLYRKMRQLGMGGAEEDGDEE